MTLMLQVGKTYVDRRGNKHTITSSNTPCAARHYYADEPGKPSWYGDGRMWMSMPCDLDLVAEVPKDHYIHHVEPAADAPLKAMAQPALTPWFPPEIKPVHHGVYDTYFTEAHVIRARWDGEWWTPVSLNAPTGFAQPRYWRGLAEQPQQPEKESDAKRLIREAIAAGATFADFMAEYAKNNTDYDKRMIQAARDEWHRDGEIEIDDVTITSGSDDDGEYVLAWVWVYDPEVQ